MLEVVIFVVVVVITVVFKPREHVRRCPEFIVVVVVVYAVH